MLMAKTGITIKLYPEGIDRIETFLFSVLHEVARLNRKLDAVLEGIGVIQTQEEHEMADLTALQDAVAADSDAVSSAVTLLGELSNQIRSLSTDPAALQALADSLDASTADLAAAVVANTPQSPVGAPDPGTSDGGTPDVAPPADSGDVPG